MRIPYLKINDLLKVTGKQKKNFNFDYVGIRFNFFQLEFKITKIFKKKFKARNLTKT